MLLITGITGHTGRYFLEELINNNYKEPIRCIVRETSDTSLIDNSGLDIEKIVGDLDDQEFIGRAMVGVSTIMHIYNIHHSPIIVQAAIKNNVKRAILVHTTGIYSQFKSASQEYKNIERKIKELASGSHCQTSITILRPTMIYGDLCDRNMSKFTKIVDKLSVIPVIDGGKSLLQPVNARDLGKAFFIVLMSPEITAGKAYDLSGDEPIKMLDVLKLISKELNKNTIYISIPLGLGVLIAKVLNKLTLGRVNYIERVQRMGENRSYDHDAAMKDFGYNPMSFEEGIHIEVQEYLKQKGN
jgi:nucleoside-diphosphate-sugar epimerase